MTRVALEIFAVLLLLLLLVAAARADQIPMATDLALEARRAEDERMVYLLYVSRPACPYCKRLEKNVLFPMRASKTYQKSVELREISFEGGQVVGFDHKSRRSIDIVRSFNVIGTPTLLFLDSTGNEIAERIVGYHSEDFYWYYFEQSIKTALKSVRH